MKIEKTRATVDAGVQTDVFKEISENPELSESRGSRKGAKPVPAGHLVKSKSGRSNAHS